MKIIETESVGRAAAYFLDELTAGGALSMCVRTRLLSLNTGRWSVLLPENARGDTSEFRTGGKFPPGLSYDIRGGARAVEVANSDECLASIFARLPNISTFAFEAVHLRRSDMALPRLSAERLAILDETVILLADGATPDAELLRCLRVANSGWYAIAIASEAKSSAWQQARQEWATDDAQRFVDAAHCVALRIYDGESFMLWRRG